MIIDNSMDGSVLDMDDLKLYQMDLKLSGDRNENSYMESLDCYTGAKKLLNAWKSTIELIRFNLKSRGDVNINNMLEIENIKAQQEISLIGQELAEVKSLSDEDVQTLTNRVALLDFEQIKMEALLQKIHQTKLLYAPLKLHIKYCEPDIHTITFKEENGSDEKATNCVTIMTKKKQNHIFYKVLEQCGMSQDVFDPINKELMKTGDLISFLVKLKKYSGAVTV